MNIRTSILLGIAALTLLASCKGGKFMGRNTETASEPLVARESKDFQTAFFSAQEYKSTDEPEKAYQAFAQARAESPENSAVYYEMARLDFELERGEEALKNIEKAIELEPDNYWYHRTMASILLEMSLFEEAIKELERLRDMRPEELETYYDLAAANLYLERGKEAIEVYNALEQRIGLDPELSLQKQRILMLMGQQEKALDEINKLIEAFDEPEFYARKAEMLLEMNRPEEARSALVDLVAKDPNNGPANMTLARIYHSERQFDNAFEALTRAFTSPDVDIDAKISALLPYFDRAYTDPQVAEQALSLLDILDDVHPDEAKTHSMFGDFLTQQGDFAGARDRFFRAVELDPVRPLIWLRLTELDAEIGDWSAMADHARRARDLYPTQAAFYLMHGIALLRLEKPQEAIVALKTGKAFVIDDPDLEANFYSNLGEAYHETAQHQKSDEAFEKAISINDGDPFVLNNYSYYLSVRNTKLERALELSGRSLELLEGTPSFLDTYGWILFRLGRYDDALIYIQQALDLAGPDPELFEHLGDVLFHTGDTAKAVDAWRRAVEAGGASETLKKKASEGTYYESPQP